MTITNIIDKVYFYTKTNSTSFPAAQMLLAVNNAYERIVSLVMKADGRWEWDDTNQTDLPVATTTLVNAQQDYTLATAHLSITAVSVKNVNGNYALLQPISQRDITIDLDEYMKTDGMPQYYDKIGSSIMLYPAPATASVTTASGLKVSFQRAPVLFTSAEVATGTKVPGFNSLYHDLISLWVSYEYAIANGLQNATQLFAEIVRKEDALKDDYSKRSKDEETVLTAVMFDSR